MSTFVIACYVNCINCSFPFNSVGKQVDALVTAVFYPFLLLFTNTPSYLLQKGLVRYFCSS